MVKRINLGDGASAQSVLTNYRGWVSQLTEDDKERLSKELEDLIYHGQLLSDQGASFKSKRTLTLGEKRVVLSARFGQRSILDRLLGFLGG